MKKTLSALVLLLLSASLLAQEGPVATDGVPEITEAPAESAALTPLAAPVEIKRMPRLTVNVEGLVAGAGPLEISLFNSAETFMKEPFYQESAKPDENGKAQVTFLNVFEGVYGLVVVQDENDNGVYDSGFLGFGAEPLGYSNDAGPWLGRPAFDAVSFDVQEDTEVTIHMN